MRNVFWSNREKIKAVFNDEFEGYLESLGVLEGVREGHYKCVCCGAIVNQQNIGGVLPVDNDIAFVCQSISCIDNV